MHCLQMIDDCPLVLPFLSTAQAVGYPVEMAECIQMVDIDLAHDLWGPYGRHWREEFQSLQQVF